jgi:hypothetical protein
MHEGSSVYVTMANLPAMNTPQFEWNKTRLPRHPKPVPPIYQPEIAAEAVYYVAHNRRREMSVGYPTVKAIYGNRIAPGLADRKLAASGYSAQQTDELIPPDRPHNLWEPLPGDRGAHGTFDSQARDFSPQFWADTNRGWLALGGALLAGIVALAAASDRDKQPLTCRVRGSSRG